MRYARLTLLIALVFCSLNVSFAQVSAVPALMNFQGRLAKPDGTPVANGNYSIRFSLHSALTGGTERWNQTLNVTVRNGVFAVLLSGFPAGTFNANLWLEIKVGAATPLTPRQQLVTVAYAMKAESVKDGAITTNSLAANAVTSAKIADSTITSADIANGTITAADLAPDSFNPLAWQLNGNSGATSGFLGTTDNQPLAFRVNNRRAMEYRYAEDTATAGSEFRSINVLGGAGINSINTPFAVGATVSGGGYDSFTGTDFPNRVTDDFGTVGGGLGNASGGFAAAIGGGSGNSAFADYATIAGGQDNLIEEGYATIGGGFDNFAQAAYATIGGGRENRVFGEYATIAGGYFNDVSGARAAVGGGSSNLATEFWSTVGGGLSNSASGAFATVPGGNDNTASGAYSFAAGNRARATHSGAFVWADGALANFASTGNNQFLIRASGGVGINTNAPGNAQLSVFQDTVGVGLFVGDLAPFGNALIQTNADITFTNTHIWCAENGNRVFSVTNGGAVHATSYSNLSDARYKINVHTFENALDTIMNLRGVTYDWKSDASGYRFGDARQVGFIAQEVEKILPELVTTDSNGYKSVAYANVVPVLVEAVKTLHSKVESLKKVEAENTELKAVLADVLKRLEKVEADKRR